MEDSSGFEGRPYEEELKHSLDRFYDMQSSGTEYFFDVSQFEDLFDYFLEQGEWETAEEVLRMARKQHPQANSINVLDAHLQLAYGKANKALTLLNQAERLEPFNDELLLMKAQVLSQLRQHRKALQYYEKAARYATDNRSEIMLDIAMELEELDDFQRAVEVLKELLESNPENEVAMHEIAFCFEAMGEPERGIEFFNGFLDDYPFSASGWFNLGELYMRHYRNDEALEAFDYATAINEDYAHSYFNKGVIFANLQDYASAISCFTECVNYEGLNPLTLCYIGECYEKSGNLQTAIEYYDKVLDVDDRWSDAWMGKAVIYDMLERYEEALKMIENALKSIPDNIEYLLFRARILTRLGYTGEAAEVYQNTVDEDPNNLDAWLDYTDFLLQTEDAHSALEMMVEGMPFFEGVPRFYYRLVAYMLRAGREAEALIFLGEALLEDYDGHAELAGYYPEALRNPNVNHLLEIYKNQS